MIKVPSNNQFSQRGASLFLIFFILITISTAVGYIGYKTTRQMVQKQSQTLPKDWQTLKNDKLGYSVSFPKDWKALDNSTSNSRKITVSDTKGIAYLDISAYKDETMKDGPAIEKAIKMLEEKFRSDPTLKVKQFKGQGPKEGGKVGGYIAEGEQAIAGVTFSFDNRGMLDTYGKIILFHAAAKKDMAKEYNPILTQIISSFKVN